MKIRRVLVPVVVASLLAGIVPLASAEPVATPDGAYVTLLLKPGQVKRSYTREEIQRLQTANAELGLGGDDEAAAAPQRAGVPDGYEMWNPGYRRTDYLYRSDTFGFGLARCNPEGTACELTDQIDVFWDQRLSGRTSTRWALAPKVRRVSGDHGVSWSFEYYCGRNITLRPDQLCAGSGADHSDSGAWNEGETIYKFFSAGNNRVYPMLKFTALWSVDGSPTTTMRYRGWDVCNTTSGSITLCEDPT